MQRKMRIAGTRVLQVEIIQIGAVAVTDGIVSEDFFSEYVRPRYYTELKGRIKKLTGITKMTLRTPTILQWCLRASENGSKKFGKDVIIVTWGPDDIPTLVKQCGVLRKGHRLASRMVQPSAFDDKAVRDRQSADNTSICR